MVSYAAITIFEKRKINLIKKLFREQRKRGKRYLIFTYEHQNIEVLWGYENE